ncbi:MFS transporter [Pedobacter sp. JY14-1]|uniref:MFS transporter n=1 Tax=Pedobacter sp. JY14-1 TaxID=3034151 RepID=UPI0023E18382|nr:MFS transporter [Pedobacter sp. JY14-1]
MKSNSGPIPTILAFALIPLSGFATDIYIPSLPSMAAHLGVSDLQVQMTLSLFLISYGVGQLFIGSLLDSFGRYRINLVSLAIFTLASIVIANTGNIYLIYAMRIIHGLTVAAIVVSKRAYFIDVFSGEKLKHYLSMFSIIWATAPIIAPFAGGYLQTYIGWQANFYFLALFGSVVLVLEMIFSGETIRQKMPFNLRTITKVYTEMFKTPSFSLGIVMLGLAYGMVMIYNLTGPFIIEHQLGLSPVVAGYSSLILGSAVMAGGLISKATINKPFRLKIWLNLGIQLLFGLVMLVSSWFFSSLYSMIFFAFIIHAASGYVFNSFFTYCLGRFPKNAGIASGLTGGINYVIVSLFSYLIISFISAKDEGNLAYSYIIMTAGALLVMYWLTRYRDEMA